MISSVHKTILVEYAGETESTLEPISVLITITKPEKSGVSYAPSVTDMSSEDIENRPSLKGLLNTLGGYTQGFSQIKLNDGGRKGFADQINSPWPERY